MVKEKAYINKGVFQPSEKLIEDTIKDLKTHCNTNNKIFIIKNILNLIKI